MFDSLKIRLNVTTFALLAVVSILMVSAVNHFQKKYALAVADKKSHILLQHNLAIHSYFNNQLKPKVFALSDAIRDPDFFDPIWMSSTYAVREIEKIYDKESGHRYYYKEVAINARSPHNEADSFERDFILRLNQDRNLKTVSGTRTIEEKPFFYTLMRGENMEQGCLRCHSTPDKAPGGLVKAYGPTRSFNRSAGETVSAVSIQIPLAEAYNEADAFSLGLSAVLLSLLLIAAVLQNMLTSRLVITPLDLFRSRTEAIANDTETLGVTIPEEYSREINALAGAFNTMSYRLKRVVGGLDATIHERIADLQESEARYQLLFENMANSFALHEMLFDTRGNPLDYRFIEVNRAFEKQTGLRGSDIVGRTVLDIMPNTETSWIETYGKVALSGEPISFESFSQELGRYYQVWAYCPKPGFFATVFSDITERIFAEKTLRSNNAKLESILRVSSLPSANIKSISDHILQSITLITESGYGFYGFVNDDETVMTIHAWSGEAMQDCSMVDKPGVFPICESGIWAEAVRRREPLILNTYADDHPAKLGLPSGHVQLTRLLVVPFFSQGKITAVAAVANRLSDYTRNDVDQMTGFLSNVQAITDSKRMEHELAQSEERYRLLTESVSVIPWEFNIPDNSWTYVGPQATWLLGYAPDEWTTLEWWLERIHPEDKTWVPDYSRTFTARGEKHSMEYRMIAKNGNIVWVNELVTIELRDNTPFIIRGVMIDISERKRIEEEKIKLESQLHQAQKMESIGSLAGGVAHDFNNKLSVILGCTYLAFTESDPDQLRTFLEEIRKAAEQSAELTRQLLAFARKQTIVPKVLDLNETVTGMLQMLRRLIGENIRLIWRPTADLWLLKFDPSQIDQILANLCVNARDSIGKDGAITIETGNSVIDKEYCARFSDAVPGEYVRLVVSDNGCGMDSETQGRIFDPFFTTKETGKGTGLGLAMVFGIVKQNGGFINVYSEPGTGTTFTIYLPRLAGKTVPAEQAGLALPAPLGRETILLVEDELGILNMASMILARQGYSVLSATSPVEAIRLAEEHAGEIHLLVTDVIMPEMNGSELAHHLQTLNPLLKCIFMSGYTADAISQHGVLAEGVNFIQKPFSLPELAAKVRAVLDRTDPTSH